MHLVTQSIVPPNAKWSFVTRRVDHKDVASLSQDFHSVVPGDLVLCKIASIGQHKKIQLASGRYSTSYKGDVAVLVCGDRYAPDQFEGSAKLKSSSADIIAGGGMVGAVQAAHNSMSTPTRVRPLGLLKNHAGDVINLADYSVRAATLPDSTLILAVVGASMNAGKTTTAVCLAHGLQKAGYQVEGVKVTGTGAFGDFNAFLDAGIPVSDFTDAGMVSTYRMPLERIESAFDALVGGAGQRGADVVVVEIADGLYQPETAEILRSSRIRRRVNGYVLATFDALGAIGGVRQMESLDCCPVAISGLVTKSVLGMREVEATTGIRCLGKSWLMKSIDRQFGCRSVVSWFTQKSEQSSVDLMPSIFHDWWRSLLLLWIAVSGMLQAVAAGATAFAMRERFCFFGNRPDCVKRLLHHRFCGCCDRSIAIVGQNCRRIGGAEIHG